MKELYPEEIQKLIDIYEPYAVGGRLADDAPQEADRKKSGSMSLD